MLPERVTTSRIVLLSLGVGVFFTSQEVLVDVAAHRPINVKTDIIEEFWYWVVWAFLVPVVLRAAERWPVERPLHRSVLRHTAIAAALTAGQVVLAFMLPHLVEWDLGAITNEQALTALRNSGTPMVWGAFMGVFFYWVILGLYTAIRYRGIAAAEGTRALRLEAELSGAKLDALRSQLRPHFLFNTLNTISVLAGTDAERTRRMLLRLSSLLRRSLDEEQHEIPLRQELEFLEDYLDIQRTRFGDNLEVRLNIDSAVLEARVPVLLLQPLVENAIEHGGTDTARNTILLSATRENGTLRLVLQDDGAGVAASGVVREGIGLKNTKARLAQLYGSRASVTLNASGFASGGTRVEVRVPIS